MRIQIKLFVATIVLLLSSFAYAQKTGSPNFSASIFDVSIEKILEMIEEQTGYKFSYSKTLVDLSRKVSVNCKEEPLNTVLDKLFSGSGISWTINKKQIILVPDASVAVQEQQAGFPKSVIVNGTIRDEEGEVIAGAVVMIIGANATAISDMDGRYAIEALPGDLLEFSLLGFAPVRKKVLNSNTINIVMSADRKLLDEVVVIGYGSVTKKNVSTAVASIKADKVSQVGASNMSSILLGRASGLQSNVQSPQPDGKVNLSVRAGGTPLYVVDGIIMPSTSMDIGSNSGTKLPNSIDRSPLSGINPSDIETIDILKDASASIYGIGASDGVIIITTKKGKSGKPVISYDGNYTLSVNTRPVEMLNAEKFMLMTNTFNRENYLYANGMYPYGNKMYDGGWSPIYPAERIAGNTVDNDWVGQVLRTGSSFSHNLSVNGGAERVKYYLSFSSFDQDGIVVNASMKKYILRGNIAVTLFPFMKLNTTINYNNNLYSNSTAGADSGSGAHTYGAYQSAVYYSPLLTSKDENGDWTRYKNMPNPVAMLNVNDSSRQESTYANINLDIDILKDLLSSKLTYGFNSARSNREYYIPSYVYFNEMYRSRGEIGSTNRLDRTVEGTLTLNHAFGSHLTIDAVAGFGFYFKHNNTLGVYYENTNDAINNDKIDIAGGPFYPKTSKSGSQRRSQFIRSNFNILDRYILSAALRRDGTDKFFKGKKYALFPTVSLAWKMSSEDFLKDVSWIDLLKVRTSYGITGRDNLGSSLIGLYTPGGTYVSFDSVQYIPFLQSSRDYPEVTWEKTRMFDAGIDFSFIRERLSGSFDLYRYDETDRLSYDPESWMSQFSSHPVNGGWYKRVGFDFNLLARPIQTRYFAWEISFNLSRAKCYWVEREPNYQYKSYQVRKNEPYDTYYYYKHSGIINLDKSNMPESQKSLPESWQHPGVAIVVDKNNDGVINEEDIFMDDDGQPKFYGGFGTNLKWKGFDLDLYFYGIYGRRRWNSAVGMGNATEIVNIEAKNQAVSIFNSFSSLTNPYNATRQGVAQSHVSALPSGLGVDLDVYDASFLRLRNITLGYTFTAEQLRKVGKWINSIRLYADAQNLFVIANYPMSDPEIKGGSGYSSMVDYPQSASFSFGAKMQL